MATAVEMMREVQRMFENTSIEFTCWRRVFGTAFGEHQNFKMVHVGEFVDSGNSTRVCTVTFVGTLTHSFEMVSSVTPIENTITASGDGETFDWADACRVKMYSEFERPVAMGIASKARVHLPAGEDAYRVSDPQGLDSGERLWTFRAGTELTVTLSVPSTALYYGLKKEKRLDILSHTFGYTAVEVNRVKSCKPPTYIVNDYSVEVLYEVCPTEFEINNWSFDGNLYFQRMGQQPTAGMVRIDGELMGVKVTPERLKNAIQAESEPKCFLANALIERRSSARNETARYGEPGPRLVKHRWVFNERGAKLVVCFTFPIHVIDRLERVALQGQLLTAFVPNNEATQEWSEARRGSLIRMLYHNLTGSSPRQ